MSGIESAELSFDWYIESGFDDGEYLSLQLYDGDSWNEVRRIDGTSGWWWAGPNENVWRSETVAIDSNYLNANFNLRFVGRASSSSEDGFVDNVKITGVTQITQPEISIADAGTTEGDLATVASTDVFVSAGSGGLDRPRGIAFGPDGHLYVTSVETDSVLRYDGVSGAFLDEFVSSGSGGLDAPRDLVFDSSGQLLVTSGQTNQVLRFNGTAGSLDQVLVEATDGLDKPQSLTYSSSTELLLVSSADSNEVLKYDALSGTFLGVFVTSASGGLSSPKWQLFTDAGDLLVVSQNGDEILKYDAAGDFQGVFNAVPSDEASTTILMGIAKGPDGNILVAEDNDLNTGRVIRLDPDSGALIDEYVSVGDGGLNSPRSIITDSEGNVYVVSYESDEILRYSPAGNAAFTVSLSSPSDSSVTVDFQTADVSATVGSDYAARSGTLVFEPGVTTRTIIVPTLNDDLPEPSEEFRVELSNAAGATLADSSAVGTIEDDGNQAPTADAGATSSNPRGMSADGRYIVGNSGDQAYRWENGTLSAVGDLTTIGRTEDDPGGTRIGSVHRVSADGSVMVGNTPVINGEADSFRIVGRGQSVNGDEAYRWENGVFTPLGDLPGETADSRARGVSGDGSVSSEMRATTHSFGTVSTECVIFRTS